MCWVTVQTWASLGLKNVVCLFAFLCLHPKGGRGLFGGGHVLSPIIDTHIKTKAIKRFNKAHAQVHGRVQEVFGALKTRFQCLRDIGSFQTLKSVAYTIKACCVLHNISKKFSVPLPCDCILEPLHPPSSVVTSATELPYDYMEVTKNEMIEMFFGHGDDDDDWDATEETNTLPSNSELCELNRLGSWKTLSNQKLLQ